MWYLWLVLLFVCLFDYCFGCIFVLPNPCFQIVWELTTGVRNTVTCAPYSNASESRRCFPWPITKTWHNLVHGFPRALHRLSVSPDYRRFYFSLVCRRLQQLLFSRARLLVPTLSGTCIFSRAFHQLLYFPRLSSFSRAFNRSRVFLVPTFSSSFIFSRAFHQSHVLSLFPPVTVFPALPIVFPRFQPIACLLDSNCMFPALSTSDLWLALD